MAIIQNSLPPPSHVACAGRQQPDTLRQAAQAAAAYGYEEINLNCNFPGQHSLHICTRPLAFLCLLIRSCTASVNHCCTHLPSPDPPSLPPPPLGAPVPVVAVQLGGSDAETLRQAAQAAAAYGYDEINLNCGCPSDRVAAGCFGAGLMLDPLLVADCMVAVREGAAAGGTTPRISVKCRCECGVCVCVWGGGSVALSARNFMGMERVEGVVSLGVWLLGVWLPQCQGSCGLLWGGADAWSTTGG
jgi:hypothetical protein